MNIIDDDLERLQVSMELKEKAVKNNNKYK